MAEATHPESFQAEKDLMRKCFGLAKELDDAGYPKAALLAVMSAHAVVGGVPDWGETAPVRRTGSVRLTVA